MSIDLKLEKSADSIVHYLKKYNLTNEKEYVALHDLAHHHKLEHVYNPDMEWHHIIEFAWKRAYRLALEDNELSLEERQILNGLNRLVLTYKNTGHNRVYLNHKILVKYKNLLQIDLKEDSYDLAHENRYKHEVKRDWYPKLRPNNPWDRR